MRWHQIDQALVALAFSAWISHAPSIVRNDDDVKAKRRTAAADFTEYSAMSAVVDSSGQTASAETEGSEAYQHGPGRISLNSSLDHISITKLLKIFRVFRGNRQA